MSQRSQTSHAPVSDTSKFQLQSCNRAEDEALFRLTVIGPLLAYDKSQGTKKHLETQIATRVFRRPGHALTTTIAVRTIRRWVAAFNKDGFQGLLPQPRNDRGHGRHFPDWLKSILMDIRQEHPSVSTPTILDHLQRAEDPECRRILAQTSLATLNRYYSEVKLARSTVRPTTHSGERRKWCAAKPGDVWHADVCHGINLTSRDQANRLPLRIHGILDDASRRVVALSAAKDERELTMIELLIRSVRRFGVPKVLYLGRVDNRRGNFRTRGVAVADGFRLDVSASIRALTPFPVAAHRTGRAVLPHPALLSRLKPSLSAGSIEAVEGSRGRVHRKCTRSGTGGSRRPSSCASS